MSEKQPPATIYLQWEWWESVDNDITWCEDRINDDDVGYTLSSEVRRIQDALRLFMHADGCFCDAAFAMPGTTVSHSAECKQATAALRRWK